MQRVRSSGSRRFLRGREGLLPDSAPAPVGADEKLGEEGVAPAVLEIVSPGDDGVARGRAVGLEDENASETGVGREALEARLEGCAIERDALLGVEALHHLEDRREVFAGRAACPERHAGRYARSSANCSCKAPR